jgi:hypothetical protein
MGALVTGRTEVLTVRQLVATAVVDRFFVMELLGWESAMSVVRARTIGALTRAARALSREALNRIGKTHALLLRSPAVKPA